MIWSRSQEILSGSRMAREWIRFGLTWTLNNWTTNLFHVIFFTTFSLLPSPNIETKMMKKLFPCEEGGNPYSRMTKICEL